MDFSNDRTPLNSSLSASRVLDQFFKDFYYELLASKALVLRAGRKSVAPEALDPEDKENAEVLPSEPQEAAPAEGEGEKNARTPANSNLSHSQRFQTVETPVVILQVLYEVQQRLRKVLAHQTEQVLHLLDQADTLQFKEAQYAMVALADEVFLTLPWAGKAAWNQQLLEGQIFQSQSAGAQIFQRLDLLLSKYDPSRVGVAKIYFHILALGFRGQYSDPKDIGIVKNYQKRLYVFIYGKSPVLDESGITKLLPDCYAHTTTSNVAVRLPGVRFWTRIIFCVLCFFLVITAVVWYDIAAPLHKALNALFSRFQDFLSMMH